MVTKTIRISDMILVNEISASDLGVHYQRETLSERQDGEREEVTFQTTRVFENKPEAARAKAVYQQVRARLRKLCSRTALGLVCPASQEAALAALVEEIDRTIIEANASFRTCRIEYAVVPVRVEHENARAQEALGRELRRYAERLVEAAASGDVDNIRRILRSGKGLETLIADTGLRTQIEDMNEAARKAARTVAKAHKGHPGDEPSALVSESVARAAEEVARRFPWADAFDVLPDEDPIHAAGAAA